MPPASPSLRPPAAEIEGLVPVVAGKDSLLIEGWDYGLDRGEIVSEPVGEVIPVQCLVGLAKDPEDLASGFDGAVRSWCTEITIPVRELRVRDRVDSIV